MDDQAPEPKSPSHGSERTEPVRSRWTPKPEQILILESIFSSGMVNPPKDETVRIRKLLEKFGTVGDANVFYWFQNRRSRSRRRQRQMQAGLLGGDSRNPSRPVVGAGAIQYDQAASSAACFDSATTTTSTASSSCSLAPSSCLVGSSSSSGAFVEEGVDDLFSFPHQMGIPEIDQCSDSSSVLCPLDSSNLHFQSGFITVFINGVPTEVPRGPFNMKAMFGEEVMLVHSSGMPVPVNEYGFSLQSLHLGESYFLVSRPT